MPISLRDVLSADHARLDELLAKTVRPDGTIDEESYVAFRRGLLTHIGIEEKILLPEARRRRPGVSPLEQELHRDHAVLAALLVPPPSQDEIEEIRAILLRHNPLEEIPVVSTMRSNGSRAAISRRLWRACGRFPRRGWRRTSTARFCAGASNN